MLGAGSGTEARELLPNLVQEAPSGLTVSASPDGPLLGFRSAVANLGRGPLVVDARRPSRRSAAMRADQVVRREGRPAVRRRAVGRLTYARAPDHAHWHFAPFERYELRRADGSGEVVRSAKQGFCLGDRYAARRLIPGAAPAPVFTSRCGLNAPGLVRLREGISVGHGDDYPPHLEGQHVRLAGLAAGRYVLVHRANPGRSLKESDYSDNVASALLELAWPGGQARIDVVATCPGRARCRAPG